MASKQPMKMIMDMPLPMPRSVICSPSHITKMVPAVMVMAVISLKPKPGLGTTGIPLGARLSRNSEMP